MRNRDLDSTESPVGVTVVKEPLVGEMYGKALPTGRIRLVFTQQFKDTDGVEKQNVKVVAPDLAADTERETPSPMTLQVEAMKEWMGDNRKGRFAVRSMQYVNNGAQVLINVTGKQLYKEVEREVEGVVGKGKDARKEMKIEKAMEPDGWQPFERVKCGKVDMDVQLMILHRYDRARSKELHFEVCLGGSSFFVKKGEAPLLGWLNDTFSRLSQVDVERAQGLKTWAFKTLTGYARKSDIGATQIVSLEKFNKLATLVQKGVNRFGENGMAVLWGMVGWVEEYWGEGTLEGDFIQADKSSPNCRVKMDQLLESYLGEVGLNMP